MSSRRTSSALSMGQPGQAGGSRQPVPALAVWDTLHRRILNRAATFLFRAVTIVAVSSMPGTDAIYAMHARWLTEVLGPGDSLFTPGAPIWTKEHLDELEWGFVAHPDTTPGRRYEEKL